MRKILPMTLLLTALYASPVLAGVVVTSTETKLDTKTTSPETVYVDGDKLKVVSANNIVIYRGDLQKFWIISPAQKSYTEMTPETMQQLGNFQQQMQQRLANMPAAQRAQMEAMMAARGASAGIPGVGPGRGAARPAAASYTKAGPAKTVANIRCDGYRKTFDGAIDEDVCIAPIGSAGLTAADFHVMDSMNAFIEPLNSSPQVPRNDVMNWGAMNRAIGFQGFPLDTVHYVNGTPDRENTVQKIERVAIPASTFDLPQGYTARQIPRPGAPR